MTSGGHNRVNFKHTQKSKKKIGKAGIGRTPWNKNTKGIMKSNKTSFKKGNKPISGFKKGIHPKTQFKKGHKPSEETRRKMSLASKGEKNCRYIDGRSKILGPRRYGDDWDQIRRLIYERDNFTCQECGLKMTNKTVAHDVHHIVPFLESFDNSIGNLITLCKCCHMKKEWEIIKKQAGRQRNYEMSRVSICRM